MLVVNLLSRLHAAGALRVMAQRLRPRFLMYPLLSPAQCNLTNQVADNPQIKLMVFQSVSFWCYSMARWV